VAVWAAGDATAIAELYAENAVPLPILGSGDGCNHIRHETFHLLLTPAFNIMQIRNYPAPPIKEKIENV